LALAVQAVLAQIKVATAAPIPCLALLRQLAVVVAAPILLMVKMAVAVAALDITHLLDQEILRQHRHLKEIMVAQAIA
jgi:hypothetical protein